MAGHSHDEHHSAEQKPVSFTVPFILAAVTILITLMFLSLCDPKAHGDHHGMENPAHAKFQDAEHHSGAAAEEKGHNNESQSAATVQDTAHTASTPAAEHEKEQHH